MPKHSRMGIYHSASWNEEQALSKDSQTNATELANKSALTALQPSVITFHEYCIKWRLLTGTLNFKGMLHRSEESELWIFNLNIHIRNKSLKVFSLPVR